MRPWDRRRVLTVTLVVVMSVLLVTGLGWAWHWRTHPTLFPGDGNGITATLEGPDDPLYVAVTFPYPGEGERITITSVAPRVVVDSADASVRFWVCELELEGTGVGALGSSGSRHFDRLCPDPVPAAGTELDVGAEPPQQLVMEVRLHEPGMLRTRGVDLTYEHGRQHGTQAIGMHMRLRSR